MGEKHDYVTIVSQHNQRWQSKVHNISVQDSSFQIREVCGKSKWKFLMAFAIRGGAGFSRGSRLPLSYFEK